MTAGNSKPTIVFVGYTGSSQVARIVSTDLISVIDQINFLINEGRYSRGDKALMIDVWDADADVLLYRWQGQRQVTPEEATFIGNETKKRLDNRAGRQGRLDLATGDR